MSSTTATACFTDAEIAAMVHAAPRAWWRAFIQLAASSGLRVNELLRLHWSDLDRRTGTVRVTSQPVPCPDDPNRVTLRTPTPAHRERFVPIEASVFDSLDGLRAASPGNTHVFVPEWRLDRLWTSIVAGTPLGSDDLAPDIAAEFQAVQRLGRHALAAELSVPLARVRWRPRPLAALRSTYAHSASRFLSPSSLAAHLGVARRSSVLKYFDLAAALRGGAA